MESINIKGFVVVWMMWFMFQSDALKCFAWLFHLTQVKQLVSSGSCGLIYYNFLHRKIKVSRMINRCKTQWFSDKAIPAYKISCVVAKQPSDDSAQDSMKMNNQNAHLPLQENTIPGDTDSHSSMSVSNDKFVWDKLTTTPEQQGLSKGAI